MPHWNTEYQVLYKDCRKSLVVKSGKKYGLLSVKKWHSANEPLCRVSGEDTRQRINGGYRPLTEASLCRVLLFTECSALGKPPLCRVLLFAECSALDKPPLCRVPVVCRVLSLWHSANNLFTECPIKSTRQSLGHSAKKPSPVVRRPQRGGCRTSLDLFHVVQLFSYLKEYYSVVWWNNNRKNLFQVFFSQSSNRTFSQSHWFSFLKALYIMMKEPGLINLQPHYCIITCYLNCCSKLHYCIMPMKENKLQGTKYSVVR